MLRLATAPQHIPTQHGNKLPHNPFSLTICIYQKLSLYIYSHSYFDGIFNSIIIYRYAATTPRLQIRIEL